MGRALVVLFLLYVVIEGALRKWAFPEFSNELFLLKDVLLFSALLVYLFDRRLRRHVSDYIYPTEVMLWVVWIAMFVGVFVLTELSTSSIAGLRYYLSAIPLVLVLPIAVGNIQRLDKFMWRYLALCCGVCVVGVVQAVSPGDALINAYAWQSDSDGVSTFGDVGEADAGLGFSLVRITGTFSYMSTYTAFLQFMFIVSIALFLCAVNEKRRLFAACGIALILANLVMTGGRGPVLTSLVLLLLFVKPAIAIFKRASGALFGVPIAMIVGATILWYFVPIFDALIDRHEAAGDSAQRVMGALLMPFYTVANADLFGTGIGDTFLGISEATAGEIYREMNFDEVSQDRIAVEVGLFGYLFVLCVKIYFLTRTFYLIREAASPDIKVWALAALACQLSTVWQIPLYNSVASAFYFLSLGLMELLRAENNMRRNTFHFHPGIGEILPQAPAQR